MKVSIALCTYNGEAYLAEQLDSILSQTVPADEIIICDDGSADQTMALLSGYDKKYPGLFRIFQNESNLGFIKNFEKAMYLCHHPIIVISDQDDVWEHDKIEQTVAFFAENPTYDGVFHDLKLIDETVVQPSYLNWKGIRYEDIIHEIGQGELFEALVKKGSFILGCALAIRKSALEKYNIKEFPMAHDYYIVQKLSSKNALGFIPESLSSYRLHSNQVYGLRYQSDKKADEKTDKNQQYFKEYVWTYLQILKRHKEINPAENEKQTRTYTAFIRNRNVYLNSLGFMKKKLYILKCIRYRYLDLTIKDLFRI